MDRLAYAVILSWGWRRRLIAFGAGAVSALAQPPFFAFPLLWLTFPVLVWLIDGAVGTARNGGVRRFGPAFATGWQFGFGYFLAGLWWIGSAFLVEAETFGWLMPLAVVALPAGLALLWGAGVAAARLLWSENWGRVFALATGLGTAEWVRGWLFTGFPWNPLGGALTAGEVLMQSAALFGVPALGFVAVAIFSAPAVMAPSVVAPDGSGGRSLILPILALTAMAALGLGGFLRLAQAEGRVAPGTSIRIVQPALSQLQKWDFDNEDAVLRTYLDLSRRGAPLAAGGVLVWPESAFPFELRQDAESLAAIAELLPPGAALITGAYRTEAPQVSAEPTAQEPPVRATRVYNSVYVLGDDGAILSGYDKVHLVPFGEYLPMEKVLGKLGLRQLVRDGFTAGVRRPALNLPLGPPFTPLICYEAIFSGEVLGEGPRPGFLLNVTNDGWFGRTIGPHQHFHQARLRAVEEGLPLVRAANTGISAVVDAYGRIVARTNLGEAATLDAALPVAAAPTAYSRWRPLPLMLSAGVGLLFATIGFFTPPLRSG